MKKYIYCVRDKKLCAFGNPAYSTEDFEHTIEMTARGLKKGQVKDVSEAKDLALYYLGEFDDIEGKFNLLPEPQKLLDYEDYLIDYGSKETND